MATYMMVVWWECMNDDDSIEGAEAACNKMN
jgi:hypothetical protein